MNKTQLTQEELEALQEKIINEHWMPTSEHFSLHVYESRWNIDGDEYILYKAIGHPDVEGFRLEISDNYTCDCMKNYGKTCKYPEKYRDGGCK